MTIKTWAERLEHIPDGEITTSAHIQSAMLEEIEELRTQLAAIAESEPVAWAMSYDGVTLYTLWCEGACALLDCEVKRHGGTARKIPLFTRPMPAQNVTELVEALTEAVTLIDNLNSAYGSNNVDSVARRGEEALSKYKGAK